MLKNPNILIVIPTKNRRPLLERAIESVYTQPYETWRIVVVNDGSTDETQAYLDSLNNPRVTFLEYKKSKGVNAARNAAYKTLGSDEWAVPLDDDDTLLPDALPKIAEAIKETDGKIPVLFFNTIIRTKKDEQMGGRDIGNAPWHDLTYEEIMTRWKRRGDGHIALNSSLFPQYLFPEDVNGFESEIFMRMARDGIRIRYFPVETLFVDRSHEGENLSATAARRDPASFMRVHTRIFQDHSPFFKTHPRFAMERALHAMKIAFRAFDLISFCYFACWCIRSFLWVAIKRSEQI